MIIDDFVKDLKYPNNNSNLTPHSQTQKTEYSHTQETFKDKQPVFYSNTDKVPFIVYLESTDKVGYNIGRSNNIKIARDIFDLKLTDVKKIKNKGTNRISIEFTSYNAANNFINNKYLIEKGYKIFIPLNFVTSKGIARAIDIDIPEDIILKNCSADHGNIQILNVKRLNRKIFKDNKPSFTPTGTVLFTFKGTKLPRFVTFYDYLEYKISVYVPPVTQCFRCLRFGHTSKNCKGKEKCINCAGSKHMDTENEFNCEPFCLNCKEAHRTTHKKCPEFLRQKNIKELMAYENITFFEANEACPRNYAQKGEYIMDPENFPSLSKKPNLPNTMKRSETTIDPSERRTYAFQNNTTKRTYQQVTDISNNKKRLIQKGYNKKLHEETLYFPNSRPNSQDSHSFKLTNSDKGPSTSYANDILPQSASTNASTIPFSEDKISTNIIYSVLNASEKTKDFVREILSQQSQFSEPYRDLDQIY